VRIEQPAAFLPALREALTANRPTVLDVMTDEHAYPPVTMFEENQRLDY
jgi:acetolactate synthase-1/2/3 large subunit